MTTTRTITITKEIEEKMRNHIEASAYPCECWNDEGHFIEASELLKALGIEPSEDFADCGFEAIEENPPVHTCKPSYKMQQARIIGALKSGWND